VIVLSLVLVVVSAVALVWGIATGTPPLVWLSLAAALVSGGLVAASVARRRERLALDPTGSPARPGDAATQTAPPPLVRPDAPSPPPHARPPYAGPPASGAQQTRPGHADPASGAHPPVPPPASPAADPQAEAPQGAPISAGAGSGDPTSRSASPPHAGLEPADVPPGARPVPGAPSVPRNAPSSRPEAAPPGEAGDALGADLEGEPPVEDIPVRDALRVAQLDDEVLVVDGHPRYHLAGCPALEGQSTGLPVSTARRTGFTPCAGCAPDRTLLARSRERRAGP
jgi:hypothetical protein